MKKHVCPRQTGKQMFFYIEELHIMGGFIVAQGEKLQSPAEY